MNNTSAGEVDINDQPHQATALENCWFFHA